MLPKNVSASDSPESSDYQKLQQEIEQVKTDFTSKNLTPAQLEKVVDHFAEFKFTNDQQFKTAFGKLNFYVNQIHIIDPEHTRDINKKMDNIAKTHNIKRYVTATKSIKALKSSVAKIKKLIGDTSSDMPTKILSDSYWKEFFDPKHRSPKILAEIFNEWRAYGHIEKQDFWSYLEEYEKSSRASSSFLAEGVTFLKAEERPDYIAHMEMKGDEVVIYDARNQPLKDGLYITVLGPDNEFYVAEKNPGKFQHSTFFGGEPVISAGKFIIENGVLKYFHATSGHYKPEKLQIFLVLDRMKQTGININAFTVQFGEGNDETSVENPEEWGPYVAYKKGNYDETAEVIADPNLLQKVASAPKPLLDIAKTAIKHGGGIYDSDTQMVIPANAHRVDLAWHETKNRIARAIKPIPYPAHITTATWSNSITDRDGLIETADRLAPAFAQSIRKIAANTETKAFFGPDHTNLVKSKASINKRIDSDVRLLSMTEKSSIKRIEDVLRGSIIVDDPAKIIDVVEQIHSYAKAMGGDAVFPNAWILEKTTGYVGVNAKILIPTNPDKTQFMIAEVQIHLKEVLDKTSTCIKEYSYAHPSAGPEFNYMTQSAAMKLMYLSAMEKVVLTK